MRALRLGRLAAVLTAALLFASLALPAWADEPPPECGPANDGQIWTDPQSEIRYQCQYVSGFGWGWHAYFPPEERYWESWMYGSPSLWVWDSAEILSSSTDGGSMEVVSRQGDQVTPELQPPGWVAGNTILYRWNGSAWVSCRDTNYIFNNLWVHSWVVGFDMSSDPDCGAGYYLTQGNGWVWDGSAWRGGGGNSPYVWVDSGGAASSAGVTSTPTTPEFRRFPKPKPPPAHRPASPVR
jgi:hypothetical protein